MYRVPTMYRVLDISRSGYYAWLGRGPSRRDQANAVLLGTIEAVHTESDRTYGSPRMHPGLPDHGVQASLNRVVRLMRVADLVLEALDMAMEQRRPESVIHHGSGRSPQAT
jgi:putative transposase